MIRVNVCHSNQRDKIFIINSMFYPLIQIIFVSCLLDISVRTLLMFILLPVRKLPCFKLYYSANFSCCFSTPSLICHVNTSLGMKASNKNCIYIIRAPVTDQRNSFIQIHLGEAISFVRVTFRSMGRISS